ncbi:hypothetical protein IEQ34_002445 [Dendrobium chrysotoxum]|uniref:Chlorophyll(Ide) b reductase NOL, chloroplastic n=1 Tax=Dendrobium chrysotoxum TaxID=161865 RepID=A0AAV7HMA7_DENCH|nr:hypothetical protein IEQ34_002445 [Dendrobium chrysotoxum]
MACAAFPTPTLSLLRPRGLEGGQATRASPLPLLAGLDSRNQTTDLSEVSSRRNFDRKSWTRRAIRAEFPPEEREPMVPPYNVLITGSTKGRAGDNVLICSRSAERVESAVQNLKEEYGEQHVWGTVCDVRVGKDVKELVAFAREKMKYVDIWINNAGSNAYSYKPLAETSDEDLMEVVTTNTLGLMICCREAINLMLSQPRGGHIFNIDGAGSDGRPTPRFAAYGATKRSVVHLTKSLQINYSDFEVLDLVLISKCRSISTFFSLVHLMEMLSHMAELQMQDVKNVMVHNLSAKFFINILAEPPEVVAEYLVRCVRSVPTSGTQKPTYIRELLLVLEETDTSLKIEEFNDIESSKIFMSKKYIYFYFNISFGMIFLLFFKAIF